MSCRARCPPFFVGRRLVDVGEPAPAELLDGGDVDGAVVEEVLDLGELGGQEAPVGPDGVPGQRDRAGLGDVRLEEGQGLGAGVGQGERRTASMAARRPDRVCMVRTKSSMSASCSGVACTTRSGPSSTRFRSSSVMRQAISTMVWRAGSSPVISRSIQASMRGHATGRRRGGRLAPVLVMSGDAARAPAPARRRAARCPPTPGRVTPAPT